MFHPVFLLMLPKKTPDGIEYPPGAIAYNA